MNTPFELEVTVASHAKYGAFRGGDGKFYKPAGPGMVLEDFKVGESYTVKGYSSESGKTNYITGISTEKVESPKEVAEAKPLKRRMTEVPTIVSSSGEPGIAEKVKLGGSRDFVKEAKGKTYSLIVANLASAGVSVDLIPGQADTLLKAIEERGYF
jgi:hypothetical protein